MSSAAREPTVVQPHTSSIVRELDAVLADAYSAENFEEALRISVEQARVMIGAHQAALSYIPRGDFTTAVHAIALSDKYEKYRHYDAMPTGAGIWALVAECKSSFCLTQAELVSHPRWKNFSDTRDARGLEHPPMRGWLAVPVLTRSEDVIGFLQLSDKYDGDFTLADLELLTHLAKLISPTMELQLANAELQGLTTSLTDQRLDALKLAKRAQHARAKARQVEERLNLALKSAAAGTWGWNIAEDTVTWDDYIHPLFGLPPGTFQGSLDDVMQMVHPEDRERLRADVTASVEEDIPFASEFRVIWPDTSIHALAARGKVYRDQATRPLRMTGVCWDVSGQRRLEEKSRHLAAIIESSDDAIISFDLAGRILSWNGGARRMFGYSVEEMVGQSIRVLLPPELPQAEAMILKRQRPEERVEHFETRRVHKDGRRIDVSVTISPVHNSAGKVIGTSTIDRDITQRLRVQETIAGQARELARSNASLARMNDDLERSRQALAEIASRLALPVRSGPLRPYEIEEFSLTDMMHCGGIIRGLARLATERQFAEVLVRFLYDQLLDKSGDRALSLVRLFETRRFDELDTELRDLARTALPDAAPETTCLTLIATAGEQASWNDSKLSKEHRVIPLPSEEAVERLPMVAQVLSQFGLEIGSFLRPQGELLVGTPDARVFHVPEARGSPFIPAQNEFVIPCGIRSVVAFGDLLPGGRLFVVLLFSKCAISREIAALFGYLSLSTRMAMLTYLAIPDRTSAQILSLDRLLRNHEQIVTDQEQRVRTAMADLAHSNADLEQFAYVASHDLQEPLRAVTGYCQLLLQRYGERLDGEAQGFIHHIVEGGSRMQALIEGLLEYSRVGSRGKRPDKIDTHQALAAALENLRMAIQETGAVVDCEPLPWIVADREQLIRLFQNLVSNALKYRGGTTPTIHISAKDNGREWVFSVRDNGIGFDPKHAKRIFMIFQRLHTRREYPGTGIGLALCERIVQRHGGRIWAESTPGHGSTFCFSLPHNGGAAG
jgi:PAS domain S-box-containing protein